MSVKFGTSGLRGLVVSLTPDVVRAYVCAFLAACDVGPRIYVGRDLRPSSPQISDVVIDSVRHAGIDVVDCGPLPTPALSLIAQEAGAGAIMITGSHIPADRNGLKFYARTGEIAKVDESAIHDQLSAPRPDTGQVGRLATDYTGAAHYIRRYTEAYGPQSLAGKRIGLYAHSAVGRDALEEILTGLGADVIPLGRSDTFVPLDTEAVSTEIQQQIKTWVETHALDALVSTDGDSDRPLLADETGRIIPGDILGQITAQALAADVVVTPISSNSGVMQKGFSDVRQTRIGSPFVIAAMQSAKGKVIGYEANGGLLLGFDARGPTGARMPALVTRDCTLPLLAVLYASRDSTVSTRISREPSIFTLADRLTDIPYERSYALLSDWQNSPPERQAFLEALGRTEAQMDTTDGIRLTTTCGDVLHVRPSGNAPEMRLYIEAKEPDVARDLQTRTMALLKQTLQGDAI